MSLGQTHFVLGTNRVCPRDIPRVSQEQPDQKVYVYVPFSCLIVIRLMGHTPSTAGTFRRKFRKNSGKTPETLSKRFLEFPSRVRLGSPKPYNSRHLRLPEHFQNSLPPSTAGDASFFRIGSGEGVSELVMEFPAVLGVFLIQVSNGNVRVQYCRTPPQRSTLK